MNVHIVVEGDIGEKYVYEAWVQYANPHLSYVKNVFDAKTNNFSITSGGGLPNYYQVIEDAIHDVNSAGNIDKFESADSIQNGSKGNGYAVFS